MAMTANDILEAWRNQARDYARTHGQGIMHTLDLADQRRADTLNFPGFPPIRAIGPDITEVKS